MLDTLNSELIESIKSVMPMSNLIYRCYKMLGCVSWSNNKQPYTLCKCNKRVAVSNPNHVCNLMTDNEQQE